MIDFSKKTYGAILAEMLERIPDTFDKRDTSPIVTAVGPAAYVLAGFYLALDNVQRAGFVTTAAGEDLDALGMLAGVKRLQASKAVRRGIFNKSLFAGFRFSVPDNNALTYSVSGADTRPAISAAINSAAWLALSKPDGEYELTYSGAAWRLNGENVSLASCGITISGTYYSGDSLTVTQASGSVSITAVPSEDITAYKLTAEEPGSVGNSYAGSILPINNMQGLTICVMTEVLVSGEDTETDEALRERITEALKRKPFAGNVSAYREYALEVAGVSGVQVYPTWNGAGTVKLSIVGGEDYKAVSSALVAEVQNIIDPSVNHAAGVGLAPIGATVTVVSATDFSVNVSASLTMESGYTIEAVRAAVEAAIEEYLLNLRKGWARQVSDVNVTYSVTVYTSQIIAAILSVPHIENVSNLKLNGTAADLVLTETSATQQTPVKGTVTLT